MGIKKLNKFWSNIHPESITKTHLGKLRGTKVAIDFNLYLYRFLLSNKSNYLKSLLHQVLKFLKFGITPVYVFDGKKPKEKIITIQKRRKRKDNMKNKRDNYKLLLENLKKYSGDKNINIEALEKNLLNDIKKIDKKLIYIKSEYLDKSKKLLELMKIPYIQADGEAEHYCSQLNHNGIVDYCLTDDMDVFPCGSVKVIRSFKFNDNFVYIYNTEQFIRKLGIDSQKFIKLSVLFGCDYIDIKFNKDLSDLEIYKLVKENVVKDILENHCRKVSLEKFNSIFDIFNKILDFKFDMIEKKKLNMMKVNYLTRNHIELLESFLKDNGETVSNHKLNSLHQYCKNTNSNSFKRKNKFNNFRPGFRQQGFNNYNNYRL